jgi:aspartyl/asparaginyl-tRNA synthetase
MTDYTVIPDKLRNDILQLTLTELFRIRKEKIQALFDVYKEALSEILFYIDKHVIAKIHIPIIVLQETSTLTIFLVSVITKFIGI